KHAGFSLLQHSCCQPTHLIEILPSRFNQHLPQRRRSSLHPRSHLFGKTLRLPHHFLRCRHQLPIRLAPPRHSPLALAHRRAPTLSEKILHAPGFDPVTGSQHPPPAARFSSSCASIPVPRPPISHYPWDNECRSPPPWYPPEACAHSPLFACAL